MHVLEWSALLCLHNLTCREAIVFSLSFAELTYHRVRRCMDLSACVHSNGFERMRAPFSYVLHGFERRHGKQVVEFLRLRSPFVFCQRERMNEFFAKKMYGLRRITFDPGAGHLFCAFLAALFLPRHEKHMCSGVRVGEFSVVYSSIGKAVLPLDSRLSKISLPTRHKKGLLRLLQ